MKIEYGIPLADGNAKRTIRRGYYRRIRYFRVERTRFNLGYRKAMPTRCLKCAYAKCRCEKGLMIA